MEITLPLGGFPRTPGKISMNPEALHTALMRPDFFPEPGPVGFLETHVSRLYFTPGHAYKIKKPVDFGFLNFTTLDRRRFYCEEEVRLNRRFAPDTYLGVIDIRRNGGKFSVGGTGEIVEYAVRMKRLPAERMLDHLLRQEDPTLPEAVRKIGERLAELHRDSPICRHDGGQSNLEVVRFNWRENFTQTKPFVGQTLAQDSLDAVHAYVRDFLSREGPLLKEREDAGWVRDGHGDLHAEHVCLTDPLRIYDCIEFNRRFRIGDVAADLAFLLMDLDFRGRRDLASELLRAYSHALGASAETGILIPFYKIYRAWVRGKVESFLSADPEATLEARRKAAERAGRYFTLATAYLAPPVILLTCGVMGTGKSTVGKALATLLGADMVRSDDLRKELAGPLAPSGACAPFEKGIYHPDFSRQTYDLLLQRTFSAERVGQSVVVDASFSQRQERDRFIQEGHRRGIPVLLLSFHCPRDIALARLERRRKEGIDPSDGRGELYDRQVERFDPPEDGAIRVDTSDEISYNVNFIILEILRKAGTR